MSGDNNDTPEYATNLGVLPPKLTKYDWIGFEDIYGRDIWDFYSFTVEASGTFGALLQASQGNLDLFLFDGNRTPLTSSNGLASNEIISYEVQPNTTYYVGVYAHDVFLGGNSIAVNVGYSLVLEAPQKPGIVDVLIPRPPTPQPPDPPPQPLPPPPPPVDGFTTNRHWTNGNAYPRQVADVNGDGRADIVGFGQDAVFVALANADGTFRDSIVSFPTNGFTTNAGWYSFQEFPRQLADVNGDGRADIVGFGQDAVFVALAKADGTYGDSIVSLPTDGFTIGRRGWRFFHPRQVADVNGDGRADIVGFGQDAVFVALANADGTYGDSIVSLPSAGFTSGSGWSYSNPRQLADVNGDGRADIVGFGEDAVFVALANANGTYGNSIVSYPTDGFTRGRGGWGNDQTWPRQLADVNGDGRADIVGFGQDAVFVALANADGTYGDSIVSHPTHGFTIGRGGWDNIFTRPRQVADVNGDGRADIVGFGQDAVFVALANADGTYGDSVVSFAGSHSNSKIGNTVSSVSISTTLDPNTQNLILTGNTDIDGTGNQLNNAIEGNTGNNKLNGNEGNDVLLGHAGNDLLAGDIGNDALNGGNGKDTLIGGLGADRFIFSGLNQRNALKTSTLKQHDRIVDFNVDESDRIQLDFDNNLATVEFPKQLFYAGKVKGNLPEAVKHVYADMNSQKMGKQSLKSNQAVFFQVGKQTFLSVNDSRQGFSHNHDLLVNVTGIDSKLDGTKANSLPVTDYFA